MGDYLLDERSTVTCPHGTGSAKPLVSNRRVRLSGANSILPVNVYGVEHCGNGNAPCTSGNFPGGAARVRSLGQPLVLVSSLSAVVPPGKFQVSAGQRRVRAV